MIIAVIFIAAIIPKHVIIVHISKGIFLLYNYTLNPEFDNLKESILNIEQIFKESQTSIHKARNELKTIDINGVKSVVKSFKIPNLINRVIYTHFRDSKAKRSYENAIKLYNLKIPTPKPVAFIEFIDSKLLSSSYFIAKHEPYEFTIREVFHHKVENHTEILRQFAIFSYNIHQKGVWHEDYSLGNILISKNGTDYNFCLVDINRMSFKKIDPLDGLRNFNKFWAKDRDDLAIIATEYAKLSNLDTGKAIDITLKAANALESRVNIKKALKGKS